MNPGTALRIAIGRAPWKPEAAWGHLSESRSTQDNKVSLIQFFKHRVERITHDVFRVPFRHLTGLHIGGTHQQPAEMSPKETPER
jgi:hypothetical protein